MEVFLGLGSNLGDRRQHLHLGIERLREIGVAVKTISPVVESPALLPADAPAQWNQAYLNLVLRVDVDPGMLSPLALRTHIKTIENSLGRNRAHRWSPRPLDIDILTWGRERIDTEVLTIPHPELLTRSFVLTPLTHLAPRARISGHEEKTVLEWSLALSPIPLWMGIVNLTPDSFSGDVGKDDPERLDTTLAALIEHGCHIIDLGAESTRPGATALDWEEEWRRLEPALAHTRALLADRPLAPTISIDTRHWQVAERALAAGADIINDVSALTDPKMQALAREGSGDWVAMHHLTIPADPSVHLPRDRPAPAQVERWMQQRSRELEAAGIDPGRLVFDPGIGFAKDALQSLELLRALPRLRASGHRILVGHSRKSFMNGFARGQRAERDIETVGASLRLCQRGVDILRVHDVPNHVRAYRAWAEVGGFEPDAQPAPDPDPIREIRS